MSWIISSDSALLLLQKVINICTTTILSDVQLYHHATKLSDGQLL